MQKMSHMNQIAKNECQMVLGTCASFQMRRLARLTTNMFNEKLRPTGLRSTQISVLLGAGAWPEESISSLADKLSLDVSTLQRSLGVLEKSGLIQLAKGHQREKKVSLTQAGLEKILEAKPYWEKAQNEFLATFGQDAWDQFLSASAPYFESQKENA